VFGLVPPTEPELCVLNRWRGVGDVVTGTGWEATPWQTTQWAAWIVTDPHGQRLVRVAALVRVAPFG
jgi:hypothetical protein